MSEPDPDAWKEKATGRERVRMVVEVLDEPATVSAIADEADVAWETADSELDRMMAENLLSEYEDDGRTKYGPNHVRQFLDQVLDLIEENGRDELERQLVAHQERLETLQEEYDAESVDEYRERLTEADRTAAEMREIRNIASTWEALETEIRLTKHALHFYEDVSRLSSAGDDRNSLTA
ncbi:MAG TPA: ArsR family transcriptional regulator [Natrialbaceae archaeon]|nr:ArsR family transcriptional regulator [Natrialbaceae archaeon]